MIQAFSPARHNKGVRIAATGSALGARLLTNEALAALGCPLSSKEIERLSGVLSRHHVDDQQSTSTLARDAIDAARASLPTTKSLERSGSLILATSSPDHLIPSTASMVHAMLGLPPCPAYDISASCSGFLFAMDAGVKDIVLGADTAVVAASEVRSRFVDITDRATSALFGDGAGAAILEPCEPGQGILALGVATQGSEKHSVVLPAGGSREPLSRGVLDQRRHFLKMEDGPGVYIAAVEGMTEVATDMLAATALSLDEIAWIIPHQANQRILRRVAWMLKADEERVISYVHDMGNISSASVIVAFDRALREGKIAPGDTVLMLAAGAGHTAGGMILQVDEALCQTMRHTPKV